MAEGGEDLPMDTFPSGSHGGDDEDTDVLIPPEGEEGESSGARRKKGKYYSKPLDVPGYKTSTSTSGEHETNTSGEQETSFTNAPSGTRIFETRQQVREELNKDIREVFPTIDKSLIPHIRRDEYNQLIFNQGKKNSRDWVIAYDGRPSHDVGLAKFPKGIRRLLGKSNEQINQEAYEKQKEEEEKQAKKEQELQQARRAKAENDEKLRDAEERIENLKRVVKEQEEAREHALTTEDKESHTRSVEASRNALRQVSVEVEGLRVERNRLEQVEINAGEGVQDGERQVEIARERVNQRLLSLRDRIKEIFKKHGFTVVSVVTAIGVVIGVIVSNLKAGLTKVAKGVGNGLKELGKKLGEILPGMIGAIASFLFKTAGEAIGFLAKNAWLLIVGLVVLAVEQFKKRSR